MAKAASKTKAKGGKVAKDRMAKARAARGKGVGSKFSGMTTEALLKAKAQLPSEDKAGHYAIRRALRAGGYKISEHRTPKAKAKGKAAAKAAVKKGTGKGKGDDWEDED